MSKTHLGFPYIINFSNLTQRWLTNGYVRNVRRMKQAPYPLVKVRLEELAPVAGRRSSDIRKSTRTPNQCNTPAKQLQTNAPNDKKLVKKKSSNKSKNNNDTTTVNLARTILNNLNIFGHKTTNTVQNQQEKNNAGKPHKNCVLDADSSSTKSGRRPSLDTVSTYLSQESRESQATSSTADLLNCGTSSDEGVDVLSLPSIVGEYFTNS